MEEAPDMELSIEELARQVASLQCKAIEAQATLAHIRHQLKVMGDKDEIEKALAFYRRFGHKEQELDTEEWFNEMFNDEKDA